MFALILLAAIGQPPADEWRTYTANPRYEVLGHMDRGVFRYTQSRPRVAAKATPKAANFGLNMPRHAEPVLEANDFEVRGTDKAMGQLVAEAAMGATQPTAPSLAEKDRAFHERDRAGAPAKPEKGLALGQCRPQPRPQPHPHPPIVPLAVERDLFLFTIVAILGLFLGLFILALKIVLIVLLVRWIYRKLTAPPPATPV